MDINIAFNTFYWECKPKLKSIYYPDIKKFMSKINLNKEEKIINSHGQELRLLK